MDGQGRQEAVSTPTPWPTPDPPVSSTPYPSTPGPPTPAATELVCPPVSHLRPIGLAVGLVCLEAGGALQALLDGAEDLLRRTRLGRGPTQELEVPPKELCREGGWWVG